MEDEILYLEMSNSRQKNTSSRSIQGDVHMDRSNLLKTFLKKVLNTMTGEPSSKPLIITLSENHD